MKLTASEVRDLIVGGYIDRRGKNVYGICPKCGGDEFGVSLEENHRFGCFRKKKCGFSGNIFSLLAFLGKSVYEAGKSYKAGTVLEGKSLINEEVVINLELEERKLPIGWKPIVDSEYLNARGFTKDDYIKYKPGITKVDPEFHNYIIFPIVQFDKIVAYIARSQKDKQEIERINNLYELQGSKKHVRRYINSTSDFGKILLGIEECTDKTNTVILVEGLFDKKNTDTCLELDTQEEVKCCCTWKCSVSDEHIFLLQQQKIDTVILLYDPDVVSEIKKTAWRLEEFFNVYIGYNADEKDPGDMTVEDFDRVLRKLETPSQFSLGKLATRRLN